MFLHMYFWTKKANYKDKSKQNTGIMALKILKVESVYYTDSKKETIHLEHSINVQYNIIMFAKYKYGFIVWMKNMQS